MLIARGATRRWCTNITKSKSAANEIIKEEKKETKLRPLTANMFELEKQSKGGFDSAMQAVKARKEKHDELYADPYFRENQLGRVEDPYISLRGSNKDGNFERSIFLKNPKIIPGTLLVMGIAFFGVTAYFQWKRDADRYSTDFQKREEGTTYIGKCDLGGPFTMTNTKTGKKVTEEDFKGKWVYIYFGFTNCPDICPDEMKKMSNVTLRMQEVVGDLFQPVFVTIDAKRDDAEAVNEYLSDYHPDFIGLTGTAEQVEKMTREYRVYHSVPDIDTFTENDYLIDHSIIQYLMDPHGEFCDYTTKEYSAPEAFVKLRKSIQKWEFEQIDKGIISSQTPITASPDLSGVHLRSSSQ
eukprot:TRINITY_DN18331_c0_g1_i1.p1 TRINITY_DN18331_c0_g1~~TRINITY_DN18331_c0_g1_i1.p1  ORF type:complete len:369 (+),score=67.81 TRINITY_DN18331_c0_g1_i1:48-1109(+)